MQTQWPSSWSKAPAQLALVGQQAQTQPEGESKLAAVSAGRYWLAYGLEKVLSLLQYC